MNGMMFYLVRHGQTDWNVARRFQGQTDTALNETGRRQAREIAGKLISILQDGGLPPIISSPLARAAETAAILAAEIGGKGSGVQFDERAKEQNYGDWEGLSLNEVKRLYSESFEQRNSNPWGCGAPGGETLAQVERRTTALLRDIAAPAVIVTHSGNILSLLGHYNVVSRENILEHSVAQDAVYVIADGRILQL